MATWCKEHNLFLNTKKTKEVIVDFRKKRQPNHTPLFIGSEEVQRVPSFKFMGLMVTEDLSWGISTASAVGKAQQRLFYLRKLRDKLPKQLLVNFYHCAIECADLWTHEIIGTNLLEINAVYTTSCLRRVRNILRGQSHPAHHLFLLLPSRRQYWAIRGSI